jgi:hypothetical protein
VTPPPKGKETGIKKKEIWETNDEKMSVEESFELAMRKI